MRKIQSNALFVSLWATLTLAAMARASAVDDFAGIMAAGFFWAIVQGLGLLYASGHSGPPPKQLTDGIAALGMLAWVFEMLVDSLLPASLSLLLWLQAARNPGLRTRRDVYFALCISMTLVIFGAAEARSSDYLALLTAYGFAALAVLVFCHQQSGLEQEMTAPVPASAAAGLSVSLRHLAALSGAVLLLAMGWYLLVPRPDPLHFGVVPLIGGDKYSRSDWEREAREDAGRLTQTGSAGEQPQGAAPANAQGGAQHRPHRSSDDTLDITRSRNESGSGGSEGSSEDGSATGNGIVMYVKADRALYLRGRTFDRFENDRWQDTLSRTRKLLPDQGKFHLPGPELGEEVRYVVQVVAPIGSALPLSAHARTIEAPAGVIAQHSAGTVFLAGDIEAGFLYSASSYLPTDSERPVAHDVVSDRAPYLQLPEDFSPRIRALAHQVAAAGGTPLAKAIALETHLRNEYAYSFETVFTSQNVTPLESFLFDTRRGHCEFFASAMAGMLRATGIPARVVNGFLAHTFNPVTGFYEVRTFDGHAWVEAYIAGYGWMTFEPTAAYPVPQRQQRTGTTLVDLKTYAETLAEQERLQGLSDSTPSISALFVALAEWWQLLLLTMKLAWDGLRAWIAAHYMQLIVLSAAGCCAAILAYHARARVFWWWATMRLRTTPAALIPLSAFRHLERVARARNAGRSECETADDYLDRLGESHAAIRPELRLLRRAFNNARYGGLKLKSDEAATVLSAFRKIGAAVVESR